MESLATFLGVSQAPTENKGQEPEAPPLDDLSPQDFCRMILRSQEYRLSVLQRIKLGTLPPGIERWLWDTAAEARPPTSPLEAWTLEQLEERTMMLVEAARRLRLSNPPEETPSGGDSVH